MLVLLWTGTSTAAICDPHSWTSVVPGVNYRDCSDKDPKVHVVMINRTLPDVELRILADPVTTATFRLQELSKLANANRAIAAINGYYWGDCADGLACNKTGYFCPSVWSPSVPLPCAGTPETTVIMNGERRTSLLPKFPSETLMGFGAGGPTGLPIRAIPGTAIDNPDNAEFRNWMYGARTVLSGGNWAVTDEDPSQAQSILGYSKREVVFLVSEEKYTLAQLRSTLAAFELTDAVQNDGGGSTRLVTRGDVDEDVSYTDAAHLYQKRRIAYGIGLVRIPAQTLCNTLRDDSGVAFGSLCVTPSGNGYDAEFIVADGAGPRCGDFQFTLEIENGWGFTDQGAFPVCTDVCRVFSYFFETGALGCAVLTLHQRNGDDFGDTEWSIGTCPTAGMGVAGRINSRVQNGIAYLTGIIDDPTLPVAWSYLPAEGTDPTASCSFSAPDALETTFTCNRPGAYNVILTVDDEVTFTTVVRFVNEAPEVTITEPRPWQLFRANTPVNVVASIDDAPGDTHICTIDWDDGTVEEFAASDSGCVSNHPYAAPGMYTVRVWAEDNFGAEGQAEVLVVAYDPNAGGTNSDGSVIAPVGSLITAPAAAEELWFHLAARYYPQIPTIPTGDAQAWLPGSSFRFVSEGLDWLVVTPDGKVAARGRGRLQNSTANYGFVYYGYQGCDSDPSAKCYPGPDRFRVVVWDLAAAENPTAGFLYDNRLGVDLDVDVADPAALKSGIVSIHSPI